MVAGAMEVLPPFLSFQPAEADLERHTKAVQIAHRIAVVTTPTACTMATSGKMLEGEAVRHETAMDTSIDTLATALASLPRAAAKGGHHREH
jgi:hypothetical protein